MRNNIKPDHDSHYNPSCFYDKGTHFEVLEALNSEIERNDEYFSIEHHIQKYGGKMPLWVIVELLSFSSLSKLYSAMYKNDQDVIASFANTTRELLVNHLHCLSNLRNKCAHMVRLYNTPYNNPAKLKVGLMRKNPAVQMSSLFAYILVLLSNLADFNSRNLLIVDLTTTIEKYSEYIDFDLIRLPSNYADLMKQYSGLT